MHMHMRMPPGMHMAEQPQVAHRAAPVGEVEDAGSGSGRAVRRSIVLPPPARPAVSHRGRDVRCSDAGFGH